jgi:signal transduction histidine kinase
LSIEAQAVLDRQGAITSVLESLPVEGSDLVPASLLHYVLRTKERVILSDASADAGKFTGDDYFARTQPKSVLCIPIVRQAEVVGLLYLENDLLAGAFTRDRLIALELLAAQAAISLQNALLLVKERAARTASEVAEHRAAFLAEAGALLSESLDYEETLDRLSQLCVRELADWCLIDIVEYGDIRRLSGTHADPSKLLLMRELERRYPPRWDSPHPSVTVLRTGEPVVMPNLPDDILRTKCMDDEHMRLIRDVGTSTALSVPLIVRGQTLGALTLGSSTPGHRYGRAELEFAEEVARRAASAIDNARLYRTSQEAVRARDEFFHVASHELHTPMTSLSLAVQSMRRAVQSGRLDAQTMTTQLELVSRQAARLTRLTNDLLDVTKMDANELSLSLTDVDLGALVTEVVERFKFDLTRARCEVSIRVSPGVVGRWDRSRIDQVVTNLLSNALKFGCGAPIEIHVGAHSGLARLVVRDHGIGMGTEERDRIFRRFERGVSEKHYGGLGLGLYISQRIVEAHGGSIVCESRPGAGSTFIVEIPMHRNVE